MKCLLAILLQSTVVQAISVDQHVSGLLVEIPPSAAQETVFALWSLIKKLLWTLQVTVSVDLTEAGIAGASLEEPLDSPNAAVLHWWLLCHGITPSSSARKTQLKTEYWYQYYKWFINLFWNQRS